ncbi:MAG: DMT family transporter [Alphaproteobacteria bacterium]
MTDIADRAQPPAGIQDRNLLGIGIAVFGWLTLACMDAGSKILTASYPVVQILWFRYLLLIVVAWWLIRRLGRGVDLRPSWLQLSRGLLLVIEMGFIVYAFSRMALADVQAILAVTPLLVTALSVPLLGERVGVRRWSAVGIAFIGMLVILRPGLGVMQPVTALVLLAALMWSLYLILTRLAGRTAPPEVSLFWLAVTGLAVLSAVVPFFWRVPTSAVDGALFFLVAVLGIIGHFCLIKAFQLTEASVLQPYTYAGLIGSIVVGYVVFGDFPDLPTLVGAMIIVASGLYVFARERRQRS